MHREFDFDLTCYFLRGLRLSEHCSGSSFCSKWKDRRERHIQGHQDQETQWNQGHSRCGPQLRRASLRVSHWCTEDSWPVKGTPSSTHLIPRLYASRLTSSLFPAKIFKFWAYSSLPSFEDEAVPLLFIRMIPEMRVGNLMARIEFMEGRVVTHLWRNASVTIVVSHRRNQNSTYMSLPPLFPFLPPAHYNL